MSGSLNLYGGFIDTTTNEGVKLINNAIQNFKNPLIGTFSLDAKDATKFTREIKDLGSQFGYEYDLKNLPTERTITAGENDGDADVLTYGERINLLETFSDENIDHARRMATVT